MKKYLIPFLFVIGCATAATAQQFSHEDYCLVWSDEFNEDGLPNPDNWNYETGYVRNDEDQYYTEERLENARVEDGRLIIEAREDNWNGHQYTSASLASWGKVHHRYGRFEARLKIDTRNGSWPAFWTLGESEEWPGNGEIDIMEYYQGKILANVAWGTEERWTAHWDAESRDLSTFPDGWEDEFHVWTMEWSPDYIRLYVDDILLNTTDLSQVQNGSLYDIDNPFHQGHYIVLNQAIGGTNGGDPSGTTFPVRYEVDYVRVYQLGNCNLDCDWQEDGDAYLDDCLQCVGGETGKEPCELECNGNLLQNSSFETGDLSEWTGWGTRSVTSSEAYNGNYGAEVGSGAVEKVVDVLPNTQYVLRAHAKANNGWVRLGVKEHGTAESYAEVSSSTWSYTEHTFTTGNSTTARIYLYNGSNGTAYGDELSLVPAGCEVTDIEGQHESAPQMALYPNPSEDGFTLQAPEPGQVKIFTSEGQLVDTFKAQKTAHYGDALAPGLYKVVFTSPSHQQTMSWIKL